MALDTRIAPEFVRIAEAFNVNLEGVVEAIWQPVYDMQVYAALGQTGLTFFQNPVGQNGRTLFDTNTTSAGSFPAQQNFLATRIEFEFLPALAALNTANYVIDVQTVMQSGVVSFDIGSKNYLRDAPLGRFPPNHRMEVSAATLAAGPLIAYAQNRGELYNITPALIPQTQNFNVNVAWPALVPISAAGTLRCTLGGYLFRTAQ